MLTGVDVTGFSGGKLFPMTGGEGQIAFRIREGHGHRGRSTGVGTFEFDLMNPFGQFNGGAFRFAPVVGGDDQVAVNIELTDVVTGSVNCECTAGIQLNWNGCIQ